MKKFLFLLLIPALACACSPKAAPAGKSGRAADIVEIIRTQRPDGSWGNDFLTVQNALALERHGETGVPYRRAKRYLRSKGL